MHGRHPAEDQPRSARNDTDMETRSPDAVPKTGCDNEPDTALTTMTASIPSSTESLQWMTGSGTRKQNRSEGREGCRSRVVIGAMTAHPERTDGRGGRRGPRTHPGTRAMPHCRREAREKALEEAHLPAAVLTGTTCYGTDDEVKTRVVKRGRATHWKRVVLFLMRPRRPPRPRGARRARNRAGTWLRRRQGRGATGGADLRRGATR